LAGLIEMIEEIAGSQRRAAHACVPRSHFRKLPRPSWILKHFVGPILAAAAWSVTPSQVLYFQSSRPWDSQACSIRRRRGNAFKRLGLRRNSN
jgi:hypothetical protein